MGTLVGWAMRLYRRSPLYPQWGRRLARLLAVFSRGKPVVRTVNGVTYRLDRGEVIEASLYYSGTFEEAAEGVIAASLSPGMTAIDVGANIGYHSFGMAKAVGRAGTVVAVEPMTRAYDRMRANAELNDFPQLRFVQVGLSDTEQGPTTVDFQNSYRLDGSTERTSETVEVTTLDELAERLGLTSVHFVKIDVDGFEGKVFRGASGLLARHRPTVLFEISPGQMATHGDQAQELVGQLVGLGYRLRTEDGHDVDDVDTLLARVGDLSVNLLAVPSRPVG